MRNEIYDIGGIYNMIRAHYINNFPHEIDFEAVDAINNLLHTGNKSANIEKVGDTYVLKNPNPTVKSNDVFSGGLQMNIINLENYLSKDVGMRKFFQDTNALQRWLEDFGFIKKGIATEKFLVTKRLI